MRNTLWRSVWVLGLLVILATACKDKESEKKIAALEARLAQLEGNNKGVTPALPEVAAPAEPEQKPDGPLPVIKFEDVNHDFGSIKDGDKVSYTYKFTNTGDAPLIIQSAQPTCGCTVSNYTKEPVPVGGSGFVTAEFDSKGKPGMQNKTVTVTANTFPKQTVLSFKAMVTGATPTN